MSITNEKLQTIKDNVSKVYHSGQMDVIQNAASLKGFESSKAVLIDNISPVTHDMGVKVRGKNLSVDVSNRTDVFFSGSPTTTYNITGSQLIKGFAVNGNATNYHITEFTNSNGTVTFKTSNVSYTVGIDVKVKSGLTYTVSANITGGTSESKPIWTVFLKDGLFQSYTTAQSFTVPNNCNQAILLIRPSAANTECSFSNVQLELGTTATAYTPYVPDLTAVKVKKQGKNLIPFPYLHLKLGTYTYNGVDFTVYEDGSILINGTATSNTTRYLYNNATDLLGLKPGITISCSKNTSDDTQQGNIYFVCNYYDSTGTMQPGAYASTTSSGKKTITDNWKGLGIYLHIPKSKTLNNLLIKPQIVIGDTADNYEPYIAPTEYTPNADGTVNGVTSLYPNTTLMTDTEGVIIDCNYYKDIDKAYNELSSAIALSGGE